MQGEIIVDALKKQRDDGLATVEPKKDEEEAWRKHCLDLANMTLATQTKSCKLLSIRTLSVTKIDPLTVHHIGWMGANVPGKKPEFLLYSKIQ